ncbi:MAG TPA: TetR/AcrR family transcriptional regulator [Streptosporangiaceae bacterium]|nr:TetR/AcrR family transcriptional regulator [Streptosporangiaceae bacterium]
MAQGLTRKQSQERTRGRIVEAAAKVFARRGYHRATVDEISSEAGFTIGALYSNFAGKEELFLAIADRQVAERVAEIEAIADAAEGEEPGEAAARRLRTFLERDPEWPLLFYEFWSLSVRNPELHGELAKRRDAIRDALARALERVAGRHGFQLRFPAPVLATAIAASLNGLAFERAADPEALPEEVFAEFVTAVLGCAIAAPTGPAAAGE